VRAPTLATWIAVAAPLLALPACVAANRSEGLVKVNDFVTLIERVHTDSELASQKIHGTADQFSAILAFNFKSDAVAAYTEFANAVEASNQQLKQLHDSIDSMKRSADPVFKKWAADLDSIDSMELRLRSQQRLLDTRKRYDEIVAAVEPTEAAYTGFQKRMKDYAVFLAHDFNEASIAMLRPDERSVREMTVALDTRFSACQQAAQDYVQASALPSGPGTQEPAAAEKPAPTKKPGNRSDG
jgi:hypothetical protein